MADIQNEIAQIENAIYGKDVRNALANGLNAINNQTNDATSILNKWFNSTSEKYSGMDVANIQKNITELNEKYTGGENLFSNANPSTPYEFSNPNFNGGFTTDENLIIGRTYTLTCLIDGNGSDAYSVSCYIYNADGTMGQSNSAYASKGSTGLGIISLTFTATLARKYALGLYANDSQLKKLIWYSLTEGNTPKSWTPSKNEANPVFRYDSNNLLSNFNAVELNTDYSSTTTVSQNSIDIKTAGLWDAWTFFQNCVPSSFNIANYPYTDFAIGFDILTNNFKSGASITVVGYPSSTIEIPDTQGVWKRIYVTWNTAKNSSNAFGITFGNSQNPKSDFSGSSIKLKNFRFGFGKTDLGFTLNSTQLVNIAENNKNIPIQLMSLGHSTTNLAITSLKTNIQVQQLGKSSINTTLENIKLKKENNLLNEKLNFIGKQLVQLQLKKLKSEVK